MRKILFIFMLFPVVIFSKDVYIPRNQGEKQYLDNLRKDRIIIGIQEDNVTDEKIGGVSLNDIIIDIFKNYLELNIEVKKGDWVETYNDFSKNKIDIIGLITKKPGREKFAEFSKKLFSENLFIASKKTRINSPSDIDGKIINVIKGDTNIEKLKLFLLNEKKNAIIKYSDEYKDDPNGLILASEFYVNGYPNKLKIGHLPDTSIGVSKKYKNLIPILNNVLVEKYGSLIGNHLEDQELKFQNKLFYENLTEKEKEYISTLNQIDIIYETDSKVSRYDKDLREVIGVIPVILDKMSKVIDVNIVNIGDKNTSWNDIYQKFRDEEAEVVVSSILNKNFDGYLYGDKIYDLETYLVTNKKNSNGTIGVIENSVYEAIAGQYIFGDNIKKYKRKEELLKDFDNGKLNSIITSEIENFNNVEYEMESLGVAPINLVFNQNNRELRDILNKALNAVGSLEINKIIKDVTLEEKIKNVIENKKSVKISKISMGITLLGIFIIVFLIYKIFSEKNISRMLRQDFLTKLPNRVVFNEFCSDDQKKIGIAILLDLNNFKHVNDKFGHSFGDKVLVEISRILKDVFKEGYLFRISGDEFYCFLEDSDFLTALENLRTGVINSVILKKYNISYSLGYYRKKDIDSFDNAFKYAGMAMRESKQKKEYSVVEATEILIREKGRELKIKDILKESIKSEFYAVFQGKIDMKNRKMIGAEALCRWENKELGFISPGEFICLAEDLKLIHLIDYKIAEETIRIAKMWRESKKIDENFTISFNLSMQTFDRDDLIDKISYFLEKYKMAPENLEIEITESLLSINISKALEKLEKIKKMGIKISLDDFTAGHSTVSLLPVLPIDIVKFDKSLIDLYNGDQEVGKIVYKTLIKLVKDLKLKIVAEGIEKEDEYKFLKLEGIDIGQGFLFSKPLKEKEFKFDI